MKSLLRLIAALGIVLSLAWSVAVGSPPARVFIEFQPGSASQVAQAAQAAGGTLHHVFDDLNAIAVTVPEAALAGLSRNPNVVFIEPDARRYLMAESVPYGIAMVKAPEVHFDATTGKGATGKGIKVGVIDSGIRLSHEEFAGMTITGGGLSSWANDLDGHGTHVAGTIAAQVNGKGVVGVAPGVSLHIFRVFDDTGKWAYSSSLLAAARHCRDAGAKIISMSLGGSTKNRTEESGMKDLYEKDGILLIAAAGNGGNTQHSYPASYASVVSVAAVDAEQKKADFSQSNNQVELAAPGVMVLSTSPIDEVNTVSVDGSTTGGFYIDGGARGTQLGALIDGGKATATNAAWSGKVVLVERGDISFADKVKNVQNSGGVAAVIYNNVVGDFYGTLGDFKASIPAISISQANGHALLPKVGLAASVTSTATAPANGYEYMSGTSMATPHVSGVAALVWSAAPGLTNKDVRQVLQSTATDLGPIGRDNDFGWGLVNAYAAWQAVGGASDVAGPVIVNPPTSGTAPVISNLASQITNAKNGSFEITFDTDKLATGEVVFTGGATGTFTSSTLTTSHKFGFRGTKGVTYTYTVYATDADGNRSAGVNGTHNN
jgi:serine protease